MSSYILPAGFGYLPVSKHFDVLMYEKVLKEETSVTFNKTEVSFYFVSKQR